MINDVYIIFKNGTPFELVRGDLPYREARLSNWKEFFPEFTYTISDVGLDLLEQHEY